jgi:hypothetical protein
MKYKRNKPIKALLDPFRENYLAREIAKFWPGDPFSYDTEGVKVKWVRPGGRLDDYLSVNYRTAKKSPFCPILTADDKLIMSLTWMEAQSLYLPIRRAVGNVGTAGLGLGYFALRAAQNDDCGRVEVYERDRRVIDYFTATFAGRPELAKIAIIEGDFRKLCRGKKYDFFLADPYRVLCSDRALDDAVLIPRANKIGCYHWWGQEKVLYEGLVERFKPLLYADEGEYVARYLASDYANLTRQRLDRPYVAKALKLMGRIGLGAERTKEKLKRIGLDARAAAKAAAAPDSPPAVAKPEPVQIEAQQPQGVGPLATPSVMAGIFKVCCD